MNVNETNNEKYELRPNRALESGISAIAKTARCISGRLHIGRTFATRRTRFCLLSVTHKLWLNNRFYSYRITNRMKK